MGTGWKLESGERTVLAGPVDEEVIEPVIDWDTEADALIMSHWQLSPQQSIACADSVTVSTAGVFSAD